MVTSLKSDAATKPDMIVAAADRLFTRFGYRRTSMDDIAAEAGVAKGTLYLYFTNKGALFRALQARNIGEAEQMCDAAEARGGDLSARIFGQLDAWFGLNLERYGASDHLPELSATRISEGKEIVEAADQAYERRLLKLIEAARPGGGLNPREVVAVLLAAARGAKYSRGVPVSPDTYRASLRCIAQLFAAALRPG